MVPVLIVIMLYIDPAVKLIGMFQQFVHGGINLVTQNRSPLLFQITTTCLYPALVVSYALIEHLISLDLYAFFRFFHQFDKFLAIAVLNKSEDKELFLLVIDTKE